MPHIAAAAAASIAAAAPSGAIAVATAGATTAAKVGVMATLKSVAFKAMANMAITAAMSAFQPQVGVSGRPVEWTLNSDGPIPFAAGRVGVAGSVVHKDTFGPDLMYYGLVSVLSGSGPIDGYESFWADDGRVVFDGSGTATTPQWRGEMWLKTTMGHQPDTALVSPPLKRGAVLPGWSSASKLSGKASYMLVMGENSKGSAYPTGEVKPLHVIRGLRVWDPRLDSTYPGGSGPCRLHDPSTWVYSANNFLWAIKWSLGLWEGPTHKGAPAHGSDTDYQVGGIGAKLSGIDLPTLVAAANIADAHGWVCAAYPTTDDDKSQVLDAFLQAGGAIYAQRAGKISCIHRAAPRTSIVTITANDTAGPIEIDTAASRIDRINTIRPKFWSEQHRWQLHALDDVTATEYKAEDGGTRPRPMDYHYVPNAKQASQLAALQIANTREGIAGIVPLKPHLQRIKPGDCFTISEPGFVLNGVKCLCLNTEFDSATKIVKVTFVSETDAKYDWAMGLSPTPPVPPVLTPVDPTFVSGPLPDDWIITPRPPAAGGGQLPGFDLSGIVSNDTATAVIIEYGSSTTGPWKQAYQGPPTVENIPLDNLQPGETYYVAVQYQRNQNYSERYIYGPYSAPFSEPSHLNGEPVQDILDKLTHVEALSASNALAVAGLDGRVDGVITEAEAILAGAEGAAALATLEAGKAGDAATASNVAAGIATTKADEAGNHATAANAERLLAEAAKVGADNSASASVLAAGQANASAGEAGDWAAASEGAAVQAAAHAADGLVYRNQSVDARDGAVAAQVAAGTSASAAQDAEEGAKAEKVAAQNAAATSITQASNAGAAASSAQISANLAAKSGVQNEWDNADLSQGTKGFTQQWGGASGNITIENLNGSRLTVRKTGGGLQEPGMVSMGSVEFGGGPFGAERTSYNMRSWRVAAGERIGIAFDARDESAAAGGAPARWAIVVRIFNNDGSVWGGVPNSDFQSTYGNNQWHRVGRVFTVPVDGYLTVEAYLQSQGAPATTVVLGARHFVFARMRPDAAEVPTFSAPAGGGALSEISAQLNITAAVAADTANRLASVAFSVTGGAGGDPFDVSFKAGPDGSDASITATKIRLRNLVNGQAVDALTVEDGKAKFSGELAVQSGVSGERTVITTNAVRVFDAGNVERVTLGRW